MRIRNNRWLLSGLLAAAVLSTGIAPAQTQPAAEDWTPPAAKTLAGGSGSPTTSPSTPTTASAPAAKIQVTEWVVFIADAYLGRINRMESIENTLPSFVEDRRNAPTDGPKPATPMPIGLIRIHSTASPNTDDRFDVSLNYKAGRALGTWPPASVRGSGILWQDLRWQADSGAASTSPPPTLMTIPENSWATTLRAGTERLLSKSVAEPFLLYDVELDYPVALQLTAAGKATFNVVQPMDATMHDLTFYQKAADGGWQTATVATMAKTPGGSMPVIEKPQPTGREAAARLAMLRAGTQPAPPEKTSTTSPATQPHGTAVTLTDSGATDSAVLAPWRKTLASAGVSTSDQSVVLQILGQYALDPNRLTAVYRMDPTEMEKLLPLEVVPQPEKISRIALVVVTGIDPRIQEELDGWVAKLGSSSWADREEAMAKIKKLGPLARARLEKATKDKDVEIVYRAEELLDVLAQ